MKKRMLLTTTAALGLVLWAYDYAFAYIDPSTGSYVLQWVLAGLLAAAFAVRMFWGNVKSFLGRLFRRGDRAKTEPNDDHQPSA